MLSSENLSKKIMIAAGLIGGIGLVYYLSTNQPQGLDDEPENLSKMDKGL